MADVSRIFALGAQRQAQTLSWRDFEGEFSETTFMDNVTAAAMLKEPSADWNGTLDVKRIRGVLDTAKKQVIQVQSTVEEMIAEQAGKCKEAEQTLQNDCDGLVEKLHGLVDNYNLISDKYTSVSSSSVAVGQSLQSLSSQKERAQKTQRLLANFLKFQEDENHMCEMLLSNEQLIEGSPALQEVVSLCDGLDKEEYSIVIDRVNKRVQSVVDKLVESLQEATMTNDLQQLAQITSCLSTFQKGMGVYQTYTHISLKRIKQELEKVRLSNERLYGDYVIYMIEYFNQLTSLFKQEVDTVYEIFERDVVCQVIVSLIDRVFNDQTLGAQFLLDMVSSAVTLSKEDKFELLAQIYEGSMKFLTTILDSIRVKERGLIGHAERIQREEESLRESMNNAFSNNLTEYYKEELMALSTAYQDVITNNMSIPITPTSTKSEIRNALKTLSPDGDSGTVTKELVTGCLSPITIIELFNTTSRSIGRLRRLECGNGMIASVTEVLFKAITDYISLILDTVMLVNSREFPTTILPGMVVNPPNTALLDTIQTLNGVVHCVQQNYLTKIRSIVPEGSEDEQICEIHVKSMYIVVEKKVSAMLQELLRQSELYLDQLFDSFSKNNTYQPPSNTGITRASDECYAVTGWLKRHLEYTETALDGGNLEQYAEALLMEFQHCFYESLLKIKKVSNTGILLLELDISCYEETLLKLNMESANIFIRVMKKLLHLISIPASILKGHVQDQDILSLDRQYVLQAMKLRSDYYRSDEVKELYQQLQGL